MKVAVLGYGASGKAVEMLAGTLGFETEIYDEKQQLGKFSEAGAADYSGCDEIVVSPGLPPWSALYRDALESGLPVISEMEFGFRYCDFPLLAVTGTNGKTTTTELTAHLLEGVGFRAAVCGNIGTPLSEQVNTRKTTGEKLDVAVIEVSSFQLERCSTFAPIAAVILNVTEDHLDRYDGSISTYSETKFAVFDRISGRDKCLLGSTLRNHAELIPDSYRDLLNSNDKFFERDGFVVYEDRPLFQLADTQLPGAHNLENLLAALGLVEAFAGSEVVARPELIDAVMSFSPGDHRIQRVVEKNGVVFINDSKATNPASVVAALEAVGGDRNVCLLLGGLDKGMDFTPLASSQGKIKKAFVIGECRMKIYETLKDSFPCEVFDDFESAVTAAKKHAVSGDVVMLSPACASMDMFKNYKERGEIFSRLVLLD